MNLDPEGKKRLESMKKTLAAGLPLAGLLAASAVTGAAGQGCGYCVPGIVVHSSPAPPEEWAPDGDDTAPKTIPFPEGEFAVTAGLMMLPEEPEVPEIPEGAADGPGENAAP